MGIAVAQAQRSGLIVVATVVTCGVLIAAIVWRLVRDRAGAAVPAT